jgi:hypothetical protein
MVGVVTSIGGTAGVHTQAAAPIAASAAAVVARDNHPWTRFQPQSWNTARTMTETFDEAGNTIHITTATATTTLTEADNDGYVLRTDMVLDIDGRRLNTPSKTTRYDLFDRTGKAATVAIDDSPATVQIDGTAISCRVVRRAATTGEEKETTTLYYAADVTPHLLRRETRITDLAGKVVFDQTTDVVTHLRLRRRVMGALLWTSQVRTIRRNNKGSTVTITYLSDAIPGGIVDRMSTEFDATGKVIRSSTLELIGYGCQCEPVRIFPRIRPRRRFRYPR